MKYSKILGCLVLINVVVATGHAQTPVYRCGNVYTDQIFQAGISECLLVKQGNISIVQTAKNIDEVRPIQESMQVKLDKENAIVLEGQLLTARQQLRTLYAELKDGEKQKSALELRNPQLFQERIDALKSRISHQEAVVAEMERELKRHTGG